MHRALAISELLTHILREVYSDEGPNLRQGVKDIARVSQPAPASSAASSRDLRRARCAAFSVDGMFLAVGGPGFDAPIYKWDLSAIVKEAGLLYMSSNLSTSRTQSYEQHASSTPPPRQRTFPSFWRRRLNRYGATQRDTQPWSSHFSWTQDLLSGMVRRRDVQDVKSREPPIIEVPYTAGKPRNYHARRKKPAANSSQTAHAHPTQQLPPNANATASTPPAAAGATGTAGTVTRPHIAFTGWRASLMGWVCCMPVQNAT
ncbi:hypothetical protein DEU56DRAFT_901349 [Suillus clintonianus]|uniref:uncharacterized protein n=1 Tax=Suillus clintonianus TaxID=1904413 RepID=UPI001B88688E|nr:uncharacterized protein DEU56DRAFT_901349 [Suillus clintonianus]KAG2137921.1 hypothetical protein DEU56DRAFT_901349 [Suillus clintonianus]